MFLLCYVFISYSKHLFFYILKMSLPPRPRKQVSYYTPTSPQRPLSSVPKVTVMERFDCLLKCALWLGVHYVPSGSLTSHRINLLSQPVRSIHGLSSISERSIDYMPGFLKVYAGYGNLRAGGVYVAPFLDIHYVQYCR